MLQKLSPAEQARFLGTVLTSVGLVALAAAIGYFAHAIYVVQQRVPELLTQIGETSEKIDPVLRQVDAIRAQIPLILKEVKATRALIPPILAESAAVRGKVAPILAEVAATRKALPPLVDTTAKLVHEASTTVHEASTTIREVEPLITEVVAEVRQTREALPGLLDRGERLVANASAAGREAGKGAVSGAIGGVLSAPFTLIGGAGKSLAGTMGLGSDAGLTAEDDERASAATDAVMRAGEIGGERSWENPDSKNHGTVRLLGERQRGEQLCFRVRQTVNLASGKNYSAKVEFCRQQDGTWAQYK